ncbi:MAG TPA: hypothetical protein VNL18_15955 [Gemmatimonadales bacterium]|nr:hypothetical protein [Gemmatimonadales bacterium]
MPLVRCDKHGIPYNSDNPRGCPACAQEKEGGDRAQIMRELARASQAGRRSSAQTVRALEEAAEQLAGRMAEPVTTQPRAPVAEPAWLDRLRDFARRQPVQAVGIPLIVVLLLAIVFRSGPSFVAQPSPPPVEAEARPLAIEPGTAISTVFTVLGVQPPRAHPEARTLERYQYGTDLTVDALNGAVYALTLDVPSMSWRGLRVGTPERTAEGTLALLGIATEPAPPTAPRADTIGGYVVYPSLDGRPLRRLRVEVRPPNGCFDVLVDIRPRAVGFVQRGERSYAAVGPTKALPERVVTRVMVVNRAVAGPFGESVC